MDISGLCIMASTSNTLSGRPLEVRPKNNMHVEANLNTQWLKSLYSFNYNVAYKTSEIVYPVSLVLKYQRENRP